MYYKLLNKYGYKVKDNKKSEMTENNKNSKCKQYCIKQQK